MWLSRLGLDGFAPEDLRNDEREEWTNEPFPLAASARGQLVSK